jgi:hypothetical protein
MANEEIEGRREDQATHDSGIRNPRHGTGSEAHCFRKAVEPRRNPDAERDASGTGERGGQRAENRRDNPGR